MEPARRSFTSRPGATSCYTRLSARATCGGVQGRGARHRDRFRFHRHAGVTMEAAPAGRHESGTLTLWSSTQIRESFATCWPTCSRCRQRASAGGARRRWRLRRQGVVYPRRAGRQRAGQGARRPVRWIGDRREDLMTTTQAWDEVIAPSWRSTADGRSPGCARRSSPTSGPTRSIRGTASIEIIQVVSSCRAVSACRTTTPRPSAWRRTRRRWDRTRGGAAGLGLRDESLLDSAARRLGLDPAEIRRRNLLRAEDLPYRSPSGISGNSGAFSRVPRAGVQGGRLR